MDAFARVDLRRTDVNPASLPPGRRVLLTLGDSADAAPMQAWWPAAMPVGDDGEIHLMFESDSARAPWEPALRVAVAVATSRGKPVCVDFYAPGYGGPMLMADEVAAVLAPGDVSVRLGPTIVVKFMDDAATYGVALRCRAVDYTPRHATAFLDAQGDREAFLVEMEYDYAQCVADYAAYGLEYVTVALNMYGEWPLLTERQWLDLCHEVRGDGGAIRTPGVVEVAREDYGLSEAQYYDLWSERAVRTAFFHRYAPYLGLEVSLYARLFERVPTSNMRELVLLIGSTSFSLADLAELPEPPVTVRVDVLKQARRPDGTKPLPLPFQWSAVLARFDAAGLTSYLTLAAQTEVALFAPDVPEATHHAGFYASKRMLGLAPAHGNLSGFYAVAKWQSAYFVRVMEAADRAVPVYFVEQPADADPYYANVVFIFSQPVELTVGRGGTTIRFDNPGDKEGSVFHGEPYRLSAD